MLNKAIEKFKAITSPESINLLVNVIEVMMIVWLVLVVSSVFRLILAYQYVISASFNWHPVIYLRRDDVLVLEDLAQSNYTHECFNYNSPPKYIRAVLECMAAMHANSIVYEVKTGTNIGSDYANCVYETSVRRENSWIIAGLQVCMNM